MEFQREDGADNGRASSGQGPPVTPGVDFGPEGRGERRRPTMDEGERHRFEFCYGKLKQFRDKLPGHLHAKLSNSQLKELAYSLVDGTVFEIIRELEDIQKLTERSLLKKRMEVVNSQKSRKVELSKRHSQEMFGAESKPHTISLLKTRHEKERKELEKLLTEEMRSTDKSIILELDQLVVDQQSTMQQAAVPFFAVTNNPQDVQLQMHLVRLLQKMSSSQK